MHVHKLFVNVCTGTEETFFLFPSLHSITSLNETCFVYGTCVCISSSCQDLRAGVVSHFQYVSSGKLSYHLSSQESRNGMKCQLWLMQICTIYDSLFNPARFLTLSLTSSGWIQVLGCVKTTKIIFQCLLKSLVSSRFAATTENLELVFVGLA